MTCFLCVSFRSLGFKREVTLIFFNPSLKTAPQSTPQPSTTVVELTTTATEPTPLSTSVLVSFTSDETFDLALLNSISPQFTNRELKVKREVSCVENFTIFFKDVL